MKAISIIDFRELYKSKSEFAVIDPREELFFSRGHLFAATNMPLSRLELMIGPCVPVKQTMIILCDDGDGLASKAGQVLTDLGYTQLLVLQGGLPGWALAGGAVFSGMSVPSKAFGEVVERELATPTITATELHQKLKNKENILLLDARPKSEHQEYCIPGSVSCPSAEMILRCANSENAQSAEIIVHCAGRTRSIIGAQTLIDAGIFKSVHSLTNGTPAWEFEGWSTEKGSECELPLPSAKDSKYAKEVAMKIRDKWAIPMLETKELEQWQKAGGTRYVFDIRSFEEFTAGHFSTSKHIAGGQLLQTTDRHIVVRNAHIALVDNDGVRAVTTAMWLKRMGWKNIVTIQISDQTHGLITGLGIESSGSDIKMIDVDEAAVMHANKSVVFCDIRRSFDYRRGHIAGAAYLTRENLVADTAHLSLSTPIVLIADDHGYAGIISRDLRGLGHDIMLLNGGIKAWIEMENPTEDGFGWLISRPADTYYESDHFDDFQVHIREHHAYLNWEVALIDHIVDEPAAVFNIH